MVYDPVRDCDVPSPAVSRRPSLWDSPAPPMPPAFADAPNSVRPVSASGSGGGGGGSLRNLLNDGDMGSRRGSDMTVSSYDEEAGNRPHISKLLNDTPPLARTTSASSARDPHSPRHSSPSMNLHPSSVGATRTARSPMMINTILSSPSTALGGHSYDHLPGGYGGLGGPSSRRSSMDTSRPMPPPPEPIRPSEYYSTPGSHSAQLLRSPSASVSPRSSHTQIPVTLASSRPGSSRRDSSRSATAPFSTVLQTTMSPDSTTRRLSEDHGVMAPRRVPYTPSGHSQSIHRPIHQEELAALRSDAYNNNPLRRRGRPAVPSWSAPSPRNSISVLSADPNGPADRDQEAGPSSSHSRGPSRRGSTAGEAWQTAPPPREESHSLKRRSTDDEPPEDGRSVARRRVVEPPAAHGGSRSNAAEVAAHYNLRPEVGVEHREYSPIIGLRKFNNWVKSVLIGKFTYRGRGQGAKVLDIGCGKGGDLNKWRQARIELYVGMDIASTSVDQARERYNTMGQRGRGGRPPFDAYFYAHDCYANSITDVLPRNLQHEMYDNVTMQFCMHYAFENASKARMMIENVSRFLRPGGRFIGTIPNASLLLERLDAVPEGEDLLFGNSCYQIQFYERRHPGVYGHEYRFYLQDAVEDVPEYVVDWDNFVDLAGEYGLDLEYRKTFNDVLQEEQGSRDFGPLLGKMGVINEHGESAMDSDQWEAANLYMAFSFVKKGGREREREMEHYR